MQSCSSLFEKVCSFYFRWKWKDDMTERNITFDYYYGNQAEQFAFYRIPKQLFTDPTFSTLSSDAKVLYGLMLDRMSLSLKNGWKDQDDKVFIFFTLEEIQGMMNCGHCKAVKMLAELDSERGIGLINRVKQGMGKPTKIYVMNFLGIDIEKETVEMDEPEEFSKAEVKTSEKEKLRVLKSRSHDFRKTELIKTDINKTDFNETEKEKINQSIDQAETKEIDRWMDYRDVFKKNIDYEGLMQRHESYVPEILEILVDTVCSKAQYFHINGSKVPAERVKERLLSLNFMDIEYVLDAMLDNTSKIQNVRTYLLATLYNAPKTINTYYQNRVNHDLYGKQKKGW